MNNTVDFLESKRKSLNKCHREALEKFNELKEQGHEAMIGPYYSTFDKNGKACQQYQAGYTVFYGDQVT